MIKTQKLTLNFCDLEMCFLSDNIYDYFNVSQGKVTVPSIDDSEEFQLADVSSNIIVRKHLNYAIPPLPTLLPTKTTPRHNTTIPHPRPQKALKGLFI